MTERFYLVASCMLPSGAWAESFGSGSESACRSRLSIATPTWPLGIVTHRTIELWVMRDGERTILETRQLD